MGILSLIFTGSAFVIAFLSALLLCALTVVFINSATAAMGTLAAIFLLETASMTPLTFHLGLWIYPPDLFVIVLLPAFSFRLLMLKKFDAIPRAWWVLGLVWMLLFVWGLSQYGTSAGVDFRPFFYLWLSAAYLATFDYDEAFARRLMKFFVIMGVGLCIIAYYRWIMGEIDYEYHRKLEQLDTTGVAFLRVVPSGGAFIITCAMFVVAYQAVTERFRPMAWFLTGIFGITVVAMQHRSVWLAASAGFVALVLALRQFRTKAGSKLFSMALAVTVLLTLITISGRFQEAVVSIEHQAFSAISITNGTFVGRVIGWQELLKTWGRSVSPVTYLVGKPFGSGYERYIGTKKVGYDPHNFYVQLLFRSGLVGLTAFLWVAAQSMRTLWAKLRRRDDAVAPPLFAMLVAQLVFYIPYGIHYSQAILFGLLLGMILSEQKKRRFTALRASGDICPN